MEIIENSWEGPFLPDYLILYYYFYIYFLFSVNIMSVPGLSWRFLFKKGSVQFSSTAQSCPTLCDPMGCSTPGFPVHHQLPELPQNHVHWVCDAMQPTYPLLSPSPAFNISQHLGLFQGVSFSHQMAKVLELKLQHQSFQWIFRTDFL